MEMAGYQAQMRLPAASASYLHYGNGAVSGSDQLRATSSSLLRRGRVRLLLSRSCSQSSLFHTQLPKSGVKRSVLIRCSRETVSTAEKVGEKESPWFLNEPGVVKDFDHELYKGAKEEEENRSFNWLAHWYPVGVLMHMDKRQPHAVTVLGRDLVMWWDQSGAEWQVFADVCPHRQAPLSEGRINEQGHLQCSYHGWAFAPSSGACTLIPQAPQDRLEVKDSKRACAKVYQSKQHQGLLFVYMDTSEGAKERAAENPPPFIPHLSDPEFVYDLGMSDLSYSYETLIENLLDPAHAPFAHHKLLANRNSAKPLEYRVEKLAKAGFSGSRVGFELKQCFVAPCLALTTATLPPPSPRQGHPWVVKLREFFASKSSGVESPKKKFVSIFYCVPMVPGKSRLFFAFPRNFLKFVHHLTPGWWKHQLQLTVLDSDSYLLHLMERQLEAGGGMANIEKLYYTPTASDAFVISFRSWLKKFGGSVPDYGPKASDRLPLTPLKTTLLDRRSSHVDNCTYCSSALRNFKSIELVLHVLPFLLVGLVAASNAKPLRSLSNFSIPLICIAVVSSIASRWLSYWIKKSFDFHDYNHALVK